MSAREKVTAMAVFATQGKTGRLCIARKSRLHAFVARGVVVPLRIQRLCRAVLNFDSTHIFASDAQIITLCVCHQEQNMFLNDTRD